MMYFNIDVSECAVNAPNTQVVDTSSALNSENFKDLLSSW